MTPIQVAAVLGFLGVAFGAFGAHWLKPTLEAHNTLAVWQTAVFYQLVHAVACLWAAKRNPLVVWIWAGGIVLFSGSLYTLALTHLSWLGPITPLGGLLFLAGWAILIAKPR